MQRLDGALIKKRKPLITMVTYGKINQDLSNHLYESLYKFLQSIDDELECTPEINLIQMPNPRIEEHGKEEEVFLKELDKITGKIVVGVTEIGIYDMVVSRNIFGFGKPGAGLLSSYRFRESSPKKMKERLGKEIIKVFGLAVDVWHCRNENCILSYHRHVQDLDRNHGVCKICTQRFIENINQYMEVQSSH
jgi:predicted Zn-dependent protease